MKFTKFLPIAAAALLLASCGQNKGKELSQISNPSDTDSLMYYFGQMRAGEYWSQATRDSLLRGEGEREAYLRGVKEGLDIVREALKEDSKADAYNQGVFMGVQLAMNLNEFSREYEVKPSKAVLYDAIAYGLRSDSTVDVQAAQKDFYDIMNRIQAAKDAKDREATAASLAQDVKDLKMTQISNVLYGRTVKPSDGAAIAPGQKAKVKIEMKKADGEPIDLPTPDEIEVGASYGSPVFSDALTSMKVGETREFATTASEIFGAHSEQLGMEPTQVVLFTVTAESVEAPKADKPDHIEVK